MPQLGTSLTSSRIKRLRNDILAKDSNFVAILPADVKGKVDDLITKTCEQMFTKTKDGHHEKFEKLLEKSKLLSPETIDLSGTQLKKWVINISSTSLVKKRQRY